MSDWSPPTATLGRWGYTLSATLGGVLRRSGRPFSRREFLGIVDPRNMVRTEPQQLVVDGIFEEAQQAWERQVAENPTPEAHLARLRALAEVDEHPWRNRLRVNAYLARHFSSSGQDIQREAVATRTRQLIDFSEMMEPSPPELDVARLIEQARVEGVDPKRLLDRYFDEQERTREGFSLARRLASDNEFERIYFTPYQNLGTEAWSLVQADPSFMAGPMMPPQLRAMASQVLLRQWRDADPPDKPVGLADEQIAQLLEPTPEPYWDPTVNDLIRRFLPWRKATRDVFVDPHGRGAIASSGVLYGNTAALIVNAPEPGDGIAADLAWADASVKSLSGRKWDPGVKLDSAVCTVVRGRTRPLGAPSDEWLGDELAAMTFFAQPHAKTGLVTTRAGLRQALDQGMLAERETEQGVRMPQRILVVGSGDAPLPRLPAEPVRSVEDMRGKLLSVADVDPAFLWLSPAAQRRSVRVTSARRAVRSAFQRGTTPPGHGKGDSTPSR